MRSSSVHWGQVGGHAPALLAFFIGSSVTAQDVPVLRHLADVKRLPGTVVAEASVPSPETAMGITGYRVRHLSLPQPVQARLQGRIQEVREGWHVTVAFARRLTVRDQPLSLVIDGRWCGFMQEGPDLKSADTVCFDAELIREDATLGVTYRTIQIVSPDPESERLMAPEAVFTGAAAEIEYASVRLQLRRPQ